jgi:hypothetical protein
MRISLSLIGGSCGSLESRLLCTMGGDTSWRGHVVAISFNLGMRVGAIFAGHDFGIASRDSVVRRARALLLWLGLEARRERKAAARGT